MNPLLQPNSQGAREAAIEGMRKRAATRGFVTPNLRKADLASLELCWAHRFAVVPLKDLIDKEQLGDAARIVGWRFFVVDPAAPEDPIAAAHVMQTEKGEMRLSELNEGQFVGNSLKVFQTILVQMEARSTESAAIPPFELLLIVAPSLCFVGWWLRPESGMESLVFPISPTLEKTNSGPISSRDLLPILREEFIRASQQR